MYDDLPSIQHTIDAEGFVLVDGKRVPNVPGKMLKHSEHRAHCLLCSQSYPFPLRVVSEYESAEGIGLRYFHAPVPGKHACACRSR